MAERQACQNRAYQRNRHQERDRPGNKHGKQWMRITKVLLHGAKYWIRRNQIHPGLFCDSFQYGCAHNASEKANLDGGWAGTP
jgi:hypothetical protein